MIEKFLQDSPQEAQALSRLMVMTEGQALLAYLHRAAETAVKDLMFSKGEDVFRMQGAADCLRTLVNKLESADEAAQKIEALVRGRARAK